ncbi:hypothetical protein CGQ24_07370 [Arthrobacter sp. 7749]|nr:hypothetical protein CGQ24_07370 [Arthrobacter sp. 7749]
MSGYNGPRWSGLGAIISPPVAKILLIALPRASLERTLLEAAISPEARAHALATWDAVLASSKLYDQRVLGLPHRSSTVANQGAPAALRDTRPEFLTADAAGDVLGLSGKRVRMLFNEKLLEGERQGNRVMLTRESVEALALRRASSTA